MKASKLFFLYVILQILPFSASLGQEKLSLTIEVNGATPGKGQAICSLFTSAETYLKQPMVKFTKPIDSNGQAQFKIDNLEPGIYAVSVIYDEDNNGKLNTGLFGIPTELVGMSNNARGRFGPPSYEKAAFVLQDSKTISITLGKAKK